MFQSFLFYMKFNGGIDFEHMTTAKVLGVCLDSILFASLRTYPQNVWRCLHFCVNFCHVSVS